MRDYYVEIREIVKRMRKREEAIRDTGVSGVYIAQEGVERGSLISQSREGLKASSVTRPFEEYHSS